VQKGEKSNDSVALIGGAGVKLLAKATALPKAEFSADQQTTTILFNIL
jgi:hypothetical protein